MAKPSKRPRRRIVKPAPSARLEKLQKDSDAKLKGHILSEVTEDGIMRMFPAPRQSQEDFLLARLKCYLGLIEQWRVALVENKRFAADSERTTAHAYKANAYEREIWPETSKLIEGRTFLSGDLAPILEKLRGRILRELEPPTALTTANGQTASVRGLSERRGYPLEALQLAKDLRQKSPNKKAAALRAECLEHFSEDDLPPDGEAFRRWLNRKRANRAN